MTSIPVFTATADEPIEETKEETATEKAGYKERPKVNVIFEMYYKELQILPPEEWETFYAKLKQPLDISFRINSIDPNAERTRSELI